MDIRTILHHQILFRNNSILCDEYSEFDEDTC